MPSSFSADITKFIQKTNLKASTVIKKLGFDAFAGLILRTPVDTGRARASWRISINAVDNSVEPERNKSSKLKGQGGVTPADAGDAARADGAMSAVKWGDSVFISNNLPYIEALENGHSRQAPQGMLRVTFEELKANFAATVQSVQ